MENTLDTLGKAARENMVICARCRHCGRRGRLMAREAAAYFGSGRDPMTLPFRCTRCNAHDVEITFGWMDSTGKDIQIEWNSAPPNERH